jgi:hypothetical protein
VYEKDLSMYLAEATTLQGKAADELTHVDDRVAIVLIRIRYAS